MTAYFRKLVPGINPPATTNTEWFSVPSDHQYQGYVRITNIGSVGSEYRIAGVAGTGVLPANAYWEVYDGTVEAGDVLDLTFDLEELETIVVYADSANVVFNYRGVDIDNA